MRRKKPLDRGGGGGGGTELFICFTSRPSASSSSAGVAPSSLRPSSSSKLLSPGRAPTAAVSDAPAPPHLSASLSRRLRNSGSIKGGQSPMFPSGGRRKGGAFEPPEPSSPKVTCIGQVRVKGGKRKPKATVSALRSRSKRAGGNAEASFRRADHGDHREGLAGKNQGWVYQIPVNICEALKTFGSCGGRSLCSPSRGPPGGDRSAVGSGKKRRRAGGSWLCGAAVARCLMEIQEDEEESGREAAGLVVEEVKRADVGLVMEGWDVEEREVVVGEVEVEKKDEILVVGKEDEGRVSVCIPPRNALLLMRCRSDPVRMAALATRFWGSPAAATIGHVEDEEIDEEEEELDNECEEKIGDLVASLKEAECQELVDGEDVGCEALEVDQVEVEAGGSSKYRNFMEEEKDRGDAEEEKEKDEVEETEMVRKDAILEPALGEAAPETQALETTDVVMEGKDEANVPMVEKDDEEVKGRQSSSSCSPSTARKEDRKLWRLGSRRHGSGRASSGGDKSGRRHSFSSDTDARRSSFSSLKDARRASFSIDRDGRRWSFSIEQEHLIAEPKVLMGSRKGKKISPEPELDKDCDVLEAPNSAEEAQQNQDNGMEETIKDREEGGHSEDAETDHKVEKMEPGREEEELEEEERQKKSGELPDCLLLMMYEPKLSMEVSKETWVCSTDFLHWKSYQSHNRRNRRQQKAADSNAGGAGESKAKDSASAGESKSKDNVESTTIGTVSEESKVPALAIEVPALVNPATKPSPVMQEPPSAAVTEQKLKLELPLVTGAAAMAPFVLKRCKSEPLRSSARLAPDACFWKDRHRPIGATGIGF